MSFRSIFVALVIAGAMVLAALIMQQRRPAGELAQPSAKAVTATGKCAECHRNETSAVVHQYETSEHARKNVACLDCHRPHEGQEAVEHRGFEIAAEVTSGSCAQCHPTQYDQFSRSRHAAPAFAAVHGRDQFTPEQIAYAEQFHPGTVDRDPNGLALLEGEAAIVSGCIGCHDIGQPNSDGSIGKCTECHSRHSTSVELARSPQTCGQCHMGPDHSQIEIYNASKHGALFAAYGDQVDLGADPKTLTTADMAVPTCATCHMSGLEGLKVTHDTTERLSYWLFAPISKQRPGYATGKAEMQEVCLKCHTKGHVDEFYAQAEATVVSTNEKVQKGLDMMAKAREEGLLTPQGFDEKLEFDYFDLWHYYGRTAKHGAYMGGADFVQWHGNYELLLHLVEMEEEIESLRERKH